MTALSLVVVGIIAALLLIVGVAGVIRPDVVVEQTRRVWRHPAGLVVAVGLRLVLGVALLLSAKASAFPTLFTVFGWLSLVAAVGILILRARIDPLIDWLADHAATAGRFAMFFGALLGGLLIYAVVPAS